MEAAPDDPHPGEAAAARRLTAIGLLASVVLHVAVLLALRTAAPAERTRHVRVIDIDTAPRAPRAEALPPEQEAPPEGPTAPEPADEVAMPEPPAPPPGDGFGLPDAGVPDAAQLAAVDAGVPLDAARVATAADAGVGDAAGAAVAAGDGVPGDDGGVAGDDGGAVAAVDGDGGLVAAAGGGADGGVAGGLPGGTGDPALGSDGGVAVVGPPGGADPTGSVTARPSSGTAANLLGYFPRGHVVTVLVRLDRLRGTEWAERVDAILAPLPDYRSLVGPNDVRLADSFDQLVFSSPRPDDAAATTLMMRTRMTGPELRDFIDQPDAPVTWMPVKGGVLGKRGPSPRVFAGDERVFLGWTPSWMILTHPRDLARLVTPRVGSDLDRAARAGDLPPWLARAATIADEAGDPTGPLMMVTAAGMFPAQIPLLGVSGGSLPGPEQATLTLELVADGFLLRGNLRYADDSAAASAQDDIERLRVGILGDRLVRFTLERVGAVNPLKNLTMQRTGRRVAFSTSASIAESRAMMAIVATFVAAAFEERRAAPVRRRPAAGAPGGGG